ncbi:hypothetical protein JCM10213_001194 [Rhodosporidiobolus nylandii]
MPSRVATAVLGFLPLLVALFAVSHLPLAAKAYIPANAVNNTAALDSSDDLIHLAFAEGVYNAKISRQLWQEGFDDNGDYTNASSVVPWTKYNKGVLIHFNESLRHEPPAAVPWIAMISCDSNGTSFSENDDIFTICRDLGAQAALLYSLHSEGCQITQEYLNDYEKVLDVFATTSVQASRIIEQQFANVNSAAYSYNSETLNASQAIITTLLDSNALAVDGNIPVNASSSADAVPVSTFSLEPTAPSVFDPNGDSGSSNDSSASASATAPSLFSAFVQPPRLFARQAISPTSASSSASSTLAGSATRSAVAPTATTRTTTNYLGAVMAAANLTVGTTGSSDGSSDSSGGGGGGGGSNQGIAMIVLYSITALVSLLFFIVILSGAIRAIRHPERYGPRAAGERGAGGGRGGGAGQTRAGGLTRAILDTFPVVRFGGGEQERRDEEAAPEAQGKKEAVEGEGDQVELAMLPAAVPTTRRRSSAETAGEEEDEVDMLEEVDLASAPMTNNARTRSESRSSAAGESFVSAVSSHPLHSTTSLALAASSPSALPGTTAPVLAPIPASPGLLDLPPPVLASQDSSASTSSSSALSPAGVDAAVAAPSVLGQAQNGEGEEDEEQSCPICFTEFEAGDELRVLPCDQRHRFHTGCIDPWLLEVSSSCPLCRLDLAANAPTSSSGDPSSLPSPGLPFAAEETDERREEERVIRHLRALLHRTGETMARSGDSIGGGGGGAPVLGGEAAAGVGARQRERSASSAGVGGAGAEGLRTRWGRYVAARRGGGRRRRSEATQERESTLA